MHLRHFAKTQPDHLALTMATSGDCLTYEQLDTLANKGAQVFRKIGLKTGDTVAIWMTNTLSYLPLYWAAQRSGLYFCAIASHLSAQETDYILKDSGAKILITNAGVKSAQTLIQDYAQTEQFENQIFSVDSPIMRTCDWAELIDEAPNEPIQDEHAGIHLVYSSGTTGHPKGIRLPLPTGAVEDDTFMSETIRNRYAVDENCVYLCPAPLYHTAPLVYSTVIQRAGGHVIVSEKFTPETCLETIEKYKVTMTQMVPTMFIRLLKLPDNTRLSYDISTLKIVIHAAAPCPIEVKHEMLDWLGPIIYEFYAGSEGNGATTITPHEWLKKPGSVGKASWGILHICDTDGKELAPNSTGLIFFEGGQEFSYLNDPQKTKDACHPEHLNWSTLGDIGHVDEDGYLFLTDRKSHMIISGGVNIYPQECENILAQHPSIHDVAVIGLPDADMGEQVVAIVQLSKSIVSSPSLAQELIQYCRTKISHIKCPKAVIFVDQLPRTDSGKLLKKKLKEGILAKNIR